VYGRKALVKKKKKEEEKRILRRKSNGTHTRWREAKGAQEGATSACMTRG
jgi:hypothetical protein